MNAAALNGFVVVATSIVFAGLSMLVHGAFWVNAHAGNFPAQVAMVAAVFGVAALKVAMPVHLATNNQRWRDNGAVFAAVCLAVVFGVVSSIGFFVDAIDSAMLRAATPMADAMAAFGLPITPWGVVLFQCFVMALFVETLSFATVSSLAPDRGNGLQPQR